MHINYQISNVLESNSYSSDLNVLYMPQYSIFDLLISFCDINLYTIDNQVKKFVQKTSKQFLQWNQNEFSKPCSVYAINNPIGHIKNNNGLAFHLNTVMFAHDTSLLALKKEDSFLLCMNSIRPNDKLVYFNDNIKYYSCDKIEKEKLEYSIPDELFYDNTEKDGVAVFCYNKTVEDGLMKDLGIDGFTKLSQLPDSLQELNKQLNQYKIFIEFDSSSIINSLCAVACGGISIIIDPNKTLSQYQNIANLYIVNSIDELKKTLAQDLQYNRASVLDNKYRNFSNFKNKITSILDNTKRKAFLL